MCRDVCMRTFIFALLLYSFVCTMVWKVLQSTRKSVAILYQISLSQKCMYVHVYVCSVIVCDTDVLGVWDGVD